MATQVSRDNKLRQVRRVLASLGPFDYLATAVLVAVYAVGTSLDDGPGTSIDFYRSAATVIPTLLIAVAIQGAGASAPPPGVAALRHATIILPDAAERDRLLGRVEHTGQQHSEGEFGPVVRDPSGNSLVLVVS